MPSPAYAGLHQRVCVWDATGGTDEYSEPTRSHSAREILVRWNNTRRKMTDPKGNVITVDAQAAVAEEIAVESLMWQGTLDELEAGQGTGTGTDLLLSETPVMRVAAVSDAKDIKGRTTGRNLGLVFRGQSLPPEGT